MTYYPRIILACLILSIIIGFVIWSGPQQRDVALVITAPTGEQVSTGASIQLTFSRPVDRRSAEERFTITPEVPGRFFWEGQDLSFLPEYPLNSDTAYTVELAAGLQDAQGLANEDPLEWTFRTRSPRLLLVGGTPGEAGTLASVAPDGSDLRLIHTEAEGITDIALAPDGQQAIYVTNRGPQRLALIMVDLGDGVTRPLVDDPQVSASGPAWTPAGDLIAFEQAAITDASVGRPRVWLAQPDGTSLGPLYGEQNVTYAPVWSPQGDRIALLDGLEQTVEVYNFTRERSSFPDNNGEPVSWSPDGTALVYTSATFGEDGAQLRIRRIDLATEESQDLTDSAAADLSPAWSPDGDWIVFARREGQDAGSTLWLMRADGSDARPLTTAGPHQDIQPVWSPDSQQIAFIRSSIGGAFASAAWVIDREGGTARQVQEDVGQVVWMP